MQRKITKWSFISIAFIIPALIIFGVMMERRVDKTLQSIGSEETPDWYDVDQSVRRGEFDKAIALGEKLIVKTPQYPEAHRRLAGACLAAGDLQKAKHHYAEAFRLFPTDENEKSLEAVERRIKADGVGVYDQAR